MAPSQAQLDHVVLLLPYQDILHPPTWLTDHFVISEGGRHSDGKTENKLILFADGSYLELIAFVNDDPQHRANHWWDKPFGVVDYALTTTSDDGFGTLKDVRERLAKTNTGISYTEPQEGGRLKPDGTKLEWRVTFPTGTTRGSVPFWCHDRTPRERRVPISGSSSSSSNSATHHPCQATGIQAVVLDVSASSSSFERLTNATAAILGYDDDDDLSSSGGGSSGSRSSERYHHHQYEVNAVYPIADAKPPSIRMVQKANNNNNKNNKNNNDDDDHGERADSLSVVFRTPMKLPPIHRKIGESGTVSLLFEG